MIRFDCAIRHRDGTPVIKDVQIEEYAQMLLADYNRNLLSGLPEKIDPFHFVEVYLGAKLDFQDIYYEDDEQPIYGLTCFNDDRIRVFDREHMAVTQIKVKAETIILDNVLLRRGRESLLLFTLLHEGGHFCMHREVFDRMYARGCQERFCHRRKEPGKKYSRRLETQRDFREHQANVFAAAIAMPRQTMEPCADKMIRCAGFPEGVFVTGLSCDNIKQKYLEQLILSFAKAYGVSNDAARIRLEKIGKIQSYTNYMRTHDHLYVFA